MIGQRLLKRQFEELADSELPKTMLFIGAEGSGRKTFATWIAQDRHMEYSVIVKAGVDTVRELISVVQNTVDDTMYILSDVEQMSANAQNALLKILEEPPKHAYFALTATQENLVLSTILSRCVSYYMDTYTDTDIMDYYRSQYRQNDKWEALVFDFCTTPGEVNAFMSQDIEGFTDYVKFVFDHIATVSGANSFKIAGKINLTDVSTNYNLTLFWRAFMSLCFKHYEENPVKYVWGISVTSNSLRELNSKGTNKAMLFDMWILKIREGWLDADSNEEE